MKYKIVATNGTVTAVGESALIRAANMLQARKVGVRMPDERLHPELHNQPVFDHLCGPFWGGFDDEQPVIRYETPEVYKQVSA